MASGQLCPPKDLNGFDASVPNTLLACDPCIPDGSCFSFQDAMQYAGLFCGSAIDTHDANIRSVFRCSSPLYSGEDISSIGWHSTAHFNPSVAAWQTESKFDKGPNVKDTEKVITATSPQLHASSDVCQAEGLISVARLETACVHAVREHEGLTHPPVSDVRASSFIDFSTKERIAGQLNPSVAKIIDDSYAAQVSCSALLAAQNAGCFNEMMMEDMPCFKNSSSWRAQSSDYGFDSTLQGSSRGHTRQDMLASPSQCSKDFSFEPGFVQRPVKPSILGKRSANIAPLQVAECSPGEGATDDSKSLLRAFSCPKNWSGWEDNYNTIEAMHQPRSRDVPRIPDESSNLLLTPTSVSSKLEESKLCRAFSWPPNGSHFEMQADISNPQRFECKERIVAEPSSSPEEKEHHGKCRNREMLHDLGSNGSSANECVSVSVSVPDRARKTVTSSDDKMKRCKVEENAVSEETIKSAKKEQSCSDMSRSNIKKKRGNSQEMPKDVIHVRARRGQATDSHSLAERVRREKISQRMKLLQDLVPGCKQVHGKAVMLDEIINYVQSLQLQVEFLSMKLAATSSNPRLESAGNGVHHVVFANQMLDSLF